MRIVDKIRTFIHELLLKLRYHNCELTPDGECFYNYVCKIMNNEIDTSNMVQEYEDNFIELADKLSLEYDMDHVEMPDGTIVDINTTQEKRQLAATMIASSMQHILNL